MHLACLQYEREMQRPLRNLVGGELVRALLIQASEQKNNHQGDSPGRRAGSTCVSTALS